MRRLGWRVHRESPEMRFVRDRSIDGGYVSGQRRMAIHMHHFRHYENHFERSLSHSCARLYLIVRHDDNVYSNSYCIY